VAISLGVDGFLSAANLMTRYFPNLNAHLDAPGSPITTARVEAAITDAFAMMQGLLLNRGLTTAAIAADTSGLRLASIINGLGAAYLVGQELAAGAAQNGGDSIEQYGEQFRAWLRRIEEGTVNFGAVTNAQESAPGIPASLQDGGDDDDPPITLSTWSQVS